MQKPRWLIGNSHTARLATSVHGAIEAARRWPTSPTARFFVWLIDLLTSRLGFARAFAEAWFGAARSIAWHRKELRALRAEREGEIAALGEAVYGDDPARAAELRSRLESIDAQIHRHEEEMAEVVASAQTRVERHRAAAQPTEAIAVEEVITAVSEAEQQEPPTEPTTPRYPR